MTSECFGNCPRRPVTSAPSASIRAIVVHAVRAPTLLRTASATRALTRSSYLCAPLCPLWFNAVAVAVRPRPTPHASRLTPAVLPHRQREHHPAVQRQDRQRLR